MMTVTVLSIIFISLCFFQNCEASKRGETAALYGSTVEIPCTPHSHESTLKEMKNHIRWTDGLGVDLLNNRFSKNESGSLHIQEAKVHDSGTYKCKITQPVLTNQDVPEVKVFEHKLIVYRLVGQSHTSNITFTLKTDVKKGQFRTAMKDILSNVCKEKELCKPGQVITNVCKEYDDKKICNASFTYKALNMPVTENCDEGCLQKTMIDELQEAAEILRQKLEKLKTDTASEMQPDMTTLSIQSHYTCNPGFHLIRTAHKKCFPCHPGSYSGLNAKSCKLCDIGSYQESFGGHICHECPDKKSTIAVGSSLKEDCIVLESHWWSNFPSIFG